MKKPTGQNLSMVIKMVDPVIRTPSQYDYHVHTQDEVEWYVSPYRGLHGGSVAHSSP